MYYPALIDREQIGDRSIFGVRFPDFPGCVSSGETLEDAMGHARQALAFHVDGMKEDGLAIPEPSSYEAATAEMAAGETLAMVPLVPVLGQGRRVTLSVDAGKLAAIDAEAARRGLTRSAFMVEATLDAI